MLTPYERHLTLLALQTPIKARGPMAKARERQAEMEARLANSHRYAEQAAQLAADAKAPGDRA